MDLLFIPSTGQRAIRYSKSKLNVENRKREFPHFLTRRMQKARHYSAHDVMAIRCHAVSFEKKIKLGQGNLKLPG